MSDPYALQRFVTAQDSGGTYRAALGEIRAGRKRGHWMWFVFPQIAGLGRSETARFFAVSGLPEARAYAAHPILGPRLVEASRALTELPGTDAVSVLGGIDAQKVHSAMTLFAVAVPDEPVFRQVLEQYFAGKQDAGTLRRLPE